LDSSGSPAQKSSTGLDENIAAGLAVIFGWIGALIFFLIEKDSRFVKFYALQELALTVGVAVLAVLGFVVSLITASMRMPFLGLGLNSLVGVIYTLLWIIMLFNAFSGKVFELPVLGKWCRQQAGM
jgi:uncharacterized membrane protein